MQRTEWKNEHAVRIHPRVQSAWFRNCGSTFLRPVIEIVQPQIVVGVGERAYRALLDAYGMAAGSFREAVERQDSSVMRAFRILSAGKPYAVLSSTPGNASPIFRTASKSIVLLGICQRDSAELILIVSS